MPVECVTANYQIKKPGQIKMEKFILVFFFIMSGVGLIGCNAFVEPQTTNPPISASPSRIDADESTERTPAFPLETRLPNETPTPSPTSTETALPNQNFQTETPVQSSTEVTELCGTENSNPDEIQASILEGIVINGIWDDPKSLGIQGGEDVGVPIFNETINSGYASVRVSPDGYWLVRTQGVDFDTSGDRTVLDSVVYSPNTDEIFQTRIQSELVPNLSLSGFQWINNEQLIIFTEPVNENPTITYIVLLPFTDETETFTVTLPGYEHQLFSGTIYPEVDPLLDYIVYPCYNQNVCGNDAFRALEISTGEIAWSIESSVSPFFFPRIVRWSPDGQFLAGFEKEEPQFSELVTYNRSGEELEKLIFASSGHSGGDFKWSPNGRFIAFRRSQGPDSTGQYIVTLAYAALDNNTIFDLCISQIQSFFWSPDSTRIAIDRINTDHQDPSKWMHNGIVVTVETGEVYKWYETNLIDSLRGWVDLISPQ
jgi:hypothetical protein